MGDYADDATDRDYAIYEKEIEGVFEIDEPYPFDHTKIDFNRKIQKVERPKVFVDIQETIRETEKAYLFKIKEINVWLPKSQTEYATNNVIAIPEWLAIKITEKIKEKRKEQCQN